MIPLLTALIIGLAIADIFSLRPVTAKIKTVLNQNSVVDFQIKFQSLQLILTAIVHHHLHDFAEQKTWFCS
jgi:hypothetical protein